MDRLPNDVTVPVENAAETLMHPTRAQAPRTAEQPNGSESQSKVAVKPAKAQRGKRALKKGEQEEEATKADPDQTESDDKAAKSAGQGAPDQSQTHAQTRSESASTSHVTKSTMSHDTGAGQALNPNTSGGLSTLIASLFIPVLVVAAQGSAAPSSRKGFLIDSPVAGVDYYINGVFAGKTAADGSFTYKPGDVVTFKVGNVNLGNSVTVNPDGRVMMQDLAGVARNNATDPKVVRLAQLLQSLDEDNDPSNGITVVVDRLRDDLPEVTVTAETNVPDLLDPNATVVPIADVLDHLNDFSDVLKGIDNTPPTAEITFDRELVTKGQEAQVTVTFSEPVKAWTDLSKLLTTNGLGTLSNFVLSSDGKTLTATLTPPRNLNDGAVTITLRNEYTDNYGNKGSEATAQVDVETKAPTARVELQPKVTVLDGLLQPTGRDAVPASAQIGADGSYIVTWANSTEAGVTKIFAQKFNAAGEKLGDVIDLGSADFASKPQVHALGTDGSYLVAYQTPENAVNVLKVIRVDASGQQTALEPIVPAALGDGANLIGAPRVFPLGTGGGFATIQLQKAADGTIGYLVKHHDANGAPVGTPTLLNMEQDGADQEFGFEAQITPIGTNGDYAVIWKALSSDGKATLLSQRFNADGTAKADPVTIGAEGNAPSADSAPRTTMIDKNGAHLVMWQGHDSDGASVTFVQRFNADGTKATDAPQTLTALRGVKEGANAPIITALGDQGDYAVVWQTATQAGTTATFVQKFGPDGQPISAPYQIDDRAGVTSLPTLVAIGDKGEFAVSWQGAGPHSASDSSIHVLRFNADGVPEVDGPKVNADNVSSQGITLESTEPGSAILVHSSIDMSLGLGALNGDNAGLWNSVPVAQAGEKVTVPTAGLQDGTYRLYVVDTNGNLSAPIERTVIIDQTRPTVLITDSKDSGAANGPVIYTFTFSEPVSGFDIDDVTVTNGTKGKFSVVQGSNGTGTVYTLVVWPTENAEGADIGVTVGKGYADLFSNAPAQDTQAEAQAYDTLPPVAPTLSLTNDTGASGTDLITSASALTVTGEPNTTVEYYHSTDDTWKATQPTATEGENTVLVRLVDAAGNNSPSQSITFTYDVTAPTFSLTLANDTGSSSTDLVTNNELLKVSANETSTTEYSADGISWTSTQPTAIDGTNTIKVRQTDTAGNVSEVQTITFTLDTVATKPTLVLQEDTGREGEADTFTDGITSNPQINVSGIEEGGTWAYQIDGTGEWIQGVGTSFDAQDGTHSYVVRHTDKAGNNTLSDAFEVTAILDPDPLAPMLVNEDGDPIAGTFSSDTNTQLILNANQTDQVQYRFVDPNATEPAPWNDLTSGVGMPLPEGKHTIETRKIDIANNYVSALTRVTIDTSAETPVLSLVEDTGDVGDGVTTNSAAKITGLEARARFELRVDDQPQWNQFSARDLDFTLLAGTHTYHLRQIDAAGNVSEIGSYTYTYVPSVTAPSLTTSDGNPLDDKQVSTSETSLQVAGLIDGATWEYRVDGGAWVTGTGNTIALLNDSEAHSYEVRQSVGGKTSEASKSTVVTFDNTRPSEVTVELEIDSGISDTDGVTNSENMTVSGLEIGTQVQYRIDGGDWVSVRVTASTMTLPLAAGQRTYEVRAVDAAGNESPVVTKTFTYISADLPAPTANLAEATGPLGTTITSKPQINVTLSQSGDGISWQYQVDGTGPWINGTGSSFDAVPGAHSYAVRQVDIAGNTSPASAPISVTFDNVAPTITSPDSARVVDADGHKPGLIGTNTVLYTAAASDSAALTYSMAESDIFNFNPATGALTFKQPMGYLPNESNAYSVDITATDAAGNATTKTVTIHVDRTNTAAPSIDLNEPKSGVQTESLLLIRKMFNPDGTYFEIVGTTLHDRSGQAEGPYTLIKKDANGNVVPGYKPLTADFLIGVGDTGTIDHHVAADGTITLVSKGYGTMVKLNADGSYKTDFGTNGAVGVNAPNFFPTGYRFSGWAVSAIDSNGIVYLGVGALPNGVSNSNATNSVFTIVNADGSLKSTVVTDFAVNFGDFPTRFVPGQNGDMFAIALRGTSSGNGITIIKFVNGVRVSSFGTDGSLNYPGSLRDFDIRPDGSILVTTVTSDGRTTNVYSHTKQGFTLFGFTPVTISDLINVTVTAANDGSFYVRGQKLVNGVYVNELRHFHANGALDTAFGTNGVFTEPFTSDAKVVRFEVGADGKLIYQLDYSVRLDPRTETRIKAETRQFTVSGGKISADSTFGDTAITYDEGNRPIGLLNGGSALTDADAAVSNYNGFTLTLSRAGEDKAEDVFGTRGKLSIGENNVLLWDGKVVGTAVVEAGKIVLTFNADVTGNMLSDIARAITYRNTSQTPGSSVSIEWVLNDNDPSGAKSTTVVQKVNLKDDKADLEVDKTVDLKVGNTAVTLDDLIEVNGKFYYLIKTYPTQPDERSTFLDKLFNEGNDTTATQRTKILPDGSELKMLNLSEVAALIADPKVTADPVWSKLLMYSGNGLQGVNTADMGTGENQHMLYYRAYNQNTQQYENVATSVSDQAINSSYTIVEVKRGSPLTDDFIKPELRLVSDNGDSDTDRVTADGRFEVVGINTGLPFEVSMDGGKTWVERPAGNPIVTIADGTYAVGQIQVRQTDLGGFTDFIYSTQTYKIDQNIKTVSLLNDQGLGRNDGISADGRVVLTGIDPAQTGVGDNGSVYEYSLDNGQTWLPGGTLPSGEYGFTLASGTYAKRSIKTRQIDADGFVTIGSNSTALTVGPDQGQGGIKLLRDNGDNPSDRITSDNQLVVDGLDSAKGIEFSLDGGQTWTAVANTNRQASLTFTVPDGIYAAGAVTVRQTDSQNFTVTLTNAQNFVVDRRVKNIDLFNDQGTFNFDKMSADTRVVVTGLDETKPYQYSTDKGVTWQTGGKVGDQLVFSVPEGTYAARSIVVRQDLGDGLISTISSSSSFTVGANAGQGTTSLQSDGGASATDMVTNNGAVRVSGIAPDQAWEYSTDGGTTWTTGALSSSGVRAVSITLPHGVYGIGQVQVRQTDKTGFVTTVKNTTTYEIDTQIATAKISFLNDTGYSATDGLTADGRLQFSVEGTLAAGDTWSYSTDGGKTWTAGTGTSQTITLADGTYAPNLFRMKITDKAGNSSTDVWGREIAVDSSDTTAPVFTNTSFVANRRDFDGTGNRDKVWKTESLLTMTTSDKNTVYYSLSGAQAHLFTISADGKIRFKEDTGLQNASGDQYNLTVIATDALGNATSKDVTLNVFDRFKPTDVKFTGDTIELTYSHPITLAANKVFGIESNDRGQFHTWNTNDTSNVTIVGNKLILKIPPNVEMAISGSYKVSADQVVESALTGDNLLTGGWASWFTLDLNVSAYNDWRTGQTIVTPEGSYAVKLGHQGNALGNVTVLGDVNGDGIDDWAMSDGRLDADGRPYSGGVYVIYGRTDGAAPNLAEIKQGIGGFMIYGATAYDNAGRTIFAAGDVNGDGLADIGVTSLGTDNFYNGKAYVVYGKQNNQHVDLANINGNSAQGRSFKNSVKDSFDALGDINGDGYDDLAHGRSDVDRVTSWDVWTEKKTVMTATTTLGQKADWLNFAANIVDTFGTFYAFFDDPLSAAVESMAEWEDKLELAIQNEDDDLAEAILDAIKQRNDLLNPLTQRITDIDIKQSGGGGGGFAKPPKDLKITITFTIETTTKTGVRWTNTLSGAGETFIELGAMNGAGATKQVISTINATRLGVQSTGLGDINGDGRNDFAVLEGGSGGVLAQLNVIFGTRNPGDVSTNNLDSKIGGFRIKDSRTTELVGEGSVTALGDINGDGLSDFGLVLDSAKATSYIIYGRNGMTGVDLAQIAAGNGGFVLSGPERRTQTVVEAIGDFNGDGLDDFVAFSRDTDSTSASGLVVIYGSKNAVSPINGKSFISDADLGYGKLGFRIRADFPMWAKDAVSAGDINGDGITDLLLRGSGRESDGSTIVLMGSPSNGKYSQLKVDQLGTKGNDTLTSTGENLVVGDLGNDTIITKGADVVLAGAGDDRIVMDQSTANALQAVLGAGGNINQLSKIEGGAGLDTLQLTNGANLDFRLVSNKMLDLNNISGRVSGVEIFDMQTDTSANKLTFALNDVLEMGVNNAFNTSKGWQNMSGSEMSALVAKAQLVVTAGTNDRVELRSSEWVNAGEVRDANNNIYNVYNAKNGEAAQLLIDKDAVLGWL